MLGAGRPTASLLIPYLANYLDLRPSARIITMDHDAIICSMIGRLMRGPDKDVHVLAWSAKSTLRGVDVLYL